MATNKKIDLKKELKIFSLFLLMVIPLIVSAFIWWVGHTINILLSVVVFCLFSLILHFVKYFRNYKYIIIGLLISSVFAAILTSSGLGEVNNAYNLQNSIDQNYGDYRFFLEVSTENGYPFVDNLLFRYDFSSNSGNLSFVVPSSILNKIKISNIRFTYPNGIIITKTELSRQSYGTNYKNKTGLDNYPFTDIYDFNISESDDIFLEFFIEFHSDKKIEPMGKFLFLFDFGHIFNINDKVVEFDLGNYVCRYPCYTEDLSYLSLKLEGRKLYVLKPHDYDDNISENKALRQEFTLNMADENLLEHIDNEKSIGTGFMVSGIVVLIEGFMFFIIEIIKKSEKMRSVKSNQPRAQQKTKVI